LLLLEAPYGQVWNRDYARLFIGHVIKKAADLAEEQGKIVYLGYCTGGKNEFYDEEFKKVVKIGEAKIYRNTIQIQLPESTNHWEYSDSLGGKYRSGSKIKKKTDLRLLVVGED